MTTATENILVVPELEPRLKHSTIFARFAAVPEGGSLIIVNDHDPKPLYYQMLGQLGNVFIWEYLEQGPELYRIKITRRHSGASHVVTQPSATQAQTAQAAGENILKVYELEPRLKHATIFQRFAQVAEGNSLTIINDHDPKPLYYQMLGELGNVFIWEYLEQGPQWFQIKITRRRSGENEETLGQIAAKDLRKAEVFKKYGLDFCCGGKKTVKEACVEKGIDPALVEQELNQADKNPVTRPLPYNEWTLDFLADYIVQTHHHYVRKALPDMVAYATKVASVHGGHHPELHDIRNLVLEVNTEMSSHMVKEEKVVFPYIKELVRNNGQASQAEDFGSIQSPINMMEEEHEVVGKALEEIRALSNNFTVPADGCASYQLLFKMLEEFESDLHIHVHLENNILFPKALEAEKR